MDKDLSTLVSLNPLEPIELVEAVLIVSNGQILYQSPLPSDPNATTEWQQLCDGMRRAHFAFKYESALNADPDRQPARSA